MNAGWRALALLLFPAVAAAQGYVCAVGGGSENYGSWSDAPYQWIVQHAANRKIVVLSANAEDQWIPTYFRSLGADTAFNLQIASTPVANDSVTYRTIKLCNGVFIKGGDQWNYVGQWRNTLTQQAIREVFLAGGVVAGTSAGAAVLGDVVFDARVGSPVSRGALRNPRSTNITLTTDFLNLVPNCLFDTHFYERSRFGRLLTMMAKVQNDSGRRILGVGLESETAVCISPDGTGEVMGAGSVVFYSPTDQTRIAANANQPLVYTNVKCDALVAGYKYNLITRQTSYVLPSAIVPGPGTQEPIVNAISIFGDAFPTSTAITQFIAAAGGAVARFVVVTSPSTSAAGQRYVDTLTARGAAAPSLLLLDASTANNATYASSISQCNGIVFTSNLSEQFSSHVDSTTLVGQALRAKLRTGVAVAFAHHDAKLAGSKIVHRTELEELAAYRGKLIFSDGLTTLRNLIVMPLIFQSDVYDWNRTAGLVWVMARSDGKTGLYVDEGSSVSIDRNGIAQAEGLTPTIVLDARNSTFVGFSVFRHSNSVGPRQSTALVSAMLHVIHGEYRYNTQTGTIITAVPFENVRHVPDDMQLLPNYPNPFNPSTTIRFFIGQSGEVVQLGVYDIVGRQVAALVEQRLSAGTHERVFEGGGLPSGVYIARLSVASRTLSRVLVLVK